MIDRWGPSGKKAAVSFTFDNLGEASDIEFKRWPIDKPVGMHHSVVRDLPTLLEAIDGFTVAFFIESWNLHVYPDAIRSIHEAGHEIGSHGQRHEIWCTLTREQEVDHLQRCIDDFAHYGIQIKGLRPPGAIAASSSAEVLPELGLTYISPLGVTTGVMDTGLVVLESVPAASDVAFYSTSFTRYRKHKPGPETLPPEEFVAGIMNEIEKTVQDGGYISTTCHPFYLSADTLRTDPARVEAVVEVLRRIAEDDRIWVATPAEVAEWMRSHPEDFQGPVSLDPPDYWNPAFFSNIKRNV